MILTLAPRSLGYFIILILAPCSLRYIIEAPKLTLSREEYLTVPTIQSDSWTQKK